MHIPKTAGKSIESYFLDRLGLSWDQRAPLLLRANDDPARGPERLAHLTANEYTQLGYLTHEQFDAAFRFTIVRNPWARLVSEFRYRKYYLQVSFRDFVLHRLPEESMRDTYRHVLPQSKFVLNDDGELCVDFVGRFESLQADFDALCELQQWPRKTLAHIDGASGARLTLSERVREAFGRTREPAHPHYTDYYDAATRARVAELYARDIELFEYSFEDFR